MQLIIFILLNKESGTPDDWKSLILYCRDDPTRTDDPHVPNVVR